MPYVQRDSDQQICAISRSAQPGFEEQLADDDPQLRSFLATVAADSPLARTDLEFVRVLEDLLEVLIRKNVLLFTELPEPAQAKILERQTLRGDNNALDLLDSEPRV
jgi:hypothetical protein